MFENVFVKRWTWSSLASSLLVLLQLVFADLVPDPLQRDVELVLHPVHVLHSMSDFWSLHNISHVEQCLVINHFGSGAQIHFIFPASSSQISQKIRFFLGLSTKKLCHRPPWSCLQRLHPRPPRGRSPLQLLLQQDLHRPSLCQQLAAGGKVLQGTKAWWVSHLHQAIFARSDRFLHRCGMEAWQLRKCQGGGLTRWPGSQGGQGGKWIVKHKEEGNAHGGKIDCMIWKKGWEYMTQEQGQRRWRAFLQQLNPPRKFIHQESGYMPAINLKPTVEWRACVIANNVILN